MPLKLQIKIIQRHLQCSEEQEAGLTGYLGGGQATADHTEHCRQQKYKIKKVITYPISQSPQFDNLVIGPLSGFLMTTAPSALAHGIIER